MKSQKINLEYPFMFKINPYSDLLEKHVQLWIDECLSLSLPVRNKHKKSCYGRLVATFFPNATFEQLIPMCRWVVVCFIFDDYYGSHPLEELKKACQKITEILNGELPDPQYPEFFNMFFIGRNELLPFVTPCWIGRFNHHNQLWLDGMGTETLYNFKNATRYPTLEEYKSIRENISGGRVLCDFFEIIAGLIMPEEMFSHPKIKRLRQLVTFMVSWCNDIHCVFWEFQRKEAMNLVLVIQNERNCSLESAYEEAHQIHKNDLNEFLQISAHLPDFGQHNQALQNYIVQAGLLLKGHDAWYERTGRYSQPEI